MRIILWCLILMTPFLNTGCSSDSYEDQIKEIQDYLDSRGLKADKILSQSVYVVIDQPGEEVKPSLASIVKVNYRGYYTDGTEFDANQGVSFPLNAVIKGWQIGIPQFGKGGKGVILMTSDSGYGANPPFGIRKNAVLVFDVEVLDF